MMWLLWVGLGLVALLALAIGWMAFQGRRMSPEHTHVCTVMLPAVRRADAWKLAYACAEWPAWAGVDKVDILQPGAEPAWRMKMGRNSMLCHTRSPREPESFEITVEDERAKIFSGVWKYRFTDAPGGGTRLELTENGTIRLALPRYMARRLMDPRMYMKRHLRLLARKFGIEGVEIEVS